LIYLKGGWLGVDADVRLNLMAQWKSALNGPDDLRLLYCNPEMGCAEALMRRVSAVGVFVAWVGLVSAVVPVWAAAPVPRGILVLDESAAGSAGPFYAGIVAAGAVQ
jgi:hypothetical protein